MGGIAFKEEPKKTGQAESYSYLVIKKPDSFVDIPGTQLLVKVPRGMENRSTHDVTSARSMMGIGTYFTAEKNDEGKLVPMQQLMAVQQKQLRDFFRLELDPRSDSARETVSTYLQSWLPREAVVTMGQVYQKEDKASKTKNAEPKLADLKPKKIKQPKETM